MFIVFLFAMCVKKSKYKETCKKITLFLFVLTQRRYSFVSCDLSPHLT